MRISDWSSDVCSSDLGHITQIHRHPVHGFEHDRSNIFRRLQQSQSADQELLLADVHDVAADLAVIGRNGGKYVAEAEVTRVQALWIALDLILAPSASRSEELRVGRAGVCTCRSWWSAYHTKKN